MIYLNDSEYLNHSELDRYRKDFEVDRYTFRYRNSKFKVCTFAICHVVAEMIRRPDSEKGEAEIYSSIKNSRAQGREDTAARKSHTVVL